VLLSAEPFAFFYCNAFKTDIVFICLVSFNIYHQGFSTYRIWLNSFCTNGGPEAAYNSDIKKIIGQNFSSLSGASTLNIRNLSQLKARKIYTYIFFSRVIYLNSLACCLTLATNNCCRLVSKPRFITK